MATAFMKHARLFSRTLDQKLEPPVKDHLKQVYSTLALATLAAAAGGYVHLFTNLVASKFLIAMATFAFGMLLVMTEDNSKNAQKRFMYLMGFASCSGLLVGPLLEIAIAINPQIVPFALLSTCLIFGSFSISAIFSNHGKWLYIGGGLTSMLTVMMFTSIINLFIGSYYLFQAQHYIGLIVFCLFVMYDTASIIEQRRRGDTDHIKHALFLFIDALDIFRTLVILLTQREANERNKRSSRNRS